MLRVSSRQRLVSWDAFDASTSDSAPLTPDADRADGTPLGRKRERDFGRAVHRGPLTPDVASVAAARVDNVPTSPASPASPTTSLESLLSMPPTMPLPFPVAEGDISPPDSDVPIWYWEAGLPKFHDLIVDASEVEGLVDDVLLHIASFLDLASVRNLMATSQKFRRFLSSDDAHHLWMEQCARKWPGFANYCKRTPLDRLCLPTAVTAFQDHRANLPLLLSLSPPSGIPTGVDRECVKLHNSRRRFSRRLASRHGYQPRQSENDATPKLLLRAEEDSGLEVIRYTGPVGTGDRCVRANAPLPRPSRCAAPDKKFSVSPPSPTAAAATSLIFGNNPHLLEMLCRGAAKAVALAGRGPEALRPFVAPRLCQDETAIDLTPSMVAYYEVSILDDDDDAEAPVEFPARRVTVRGHAVSDCVAVGLATEDFHLYSRMPGWDGFSYGYHGDDGGTFHASGGMIDHFGPSFGRGDTVGCGVDYVKRGIFYTLNGKFLGYGWCGMDSELLLDDLYPTIGIDTNAPVRLNFGTRPFQFDLSEVTSAHEADIKSHFKWSSCATRRHHHLHAKPASPASPTHRRVRKHRGFRRSSRQDKAAPSGDK